MPSSDLEEYCWATQKMASWLKNHGGESTQTNKTAFIYLKITNPLCFFSSPINQKPRDGWSLIKMSLIQELICQGVRHKKWCKFSRRHHDTWNTELQVLRDPWCFDGAQNNWCFSYSVPNRTASTQNIFDLKFLTVSLWLLQVSKQIHCCFCFLSISAVCCKDGLPSPAVSSQHCGAEVLWAVHALQAVAVNLSSSQQPDGRRKRYFRTWWSLLSSEVWGSVGQDVFSQWNLDLVYSLRHCGCVEYCKR